MAGNMLNIKACSPLKRHSSLTGNYHEICHYSYNLPLPAMPQLYRQLVIEKTELNTLRQK